MPVPEEHKEYWENEARKSNPRLWELKDKLAAVEQENERLRKRVEEYESKKLLMDQFEIIDTIRADERRKTVEEIILLAKETWLKANPRSATERALISFSDEIRRKFIDGTESGN